MKKTACLLLALLLFASCAKQPGLGGSAQRPTISSELGQFRPAAKGDYVATIATSLGDISILLFAEHAPQAVENFRLLAEKEYYNNTLFHRVKKDFVIQGGDGTGTGNGGESAWGAPFPIEYSSDLYHFSGALCAVSASPPPGQITSQFYIISTPANNCSDEDTLANLQAASYSAAAIEAYKQAGGAPYLDRQDTVFGQVLSGMDIVDKIANVSVGSGGKPATDIVVSSITIHIVE